MSVKPLRVQIHLNLANPERAESVVKIQSMSGAWVTVAYAQELLLHNATPLVNKAQQERISTRQRGKVPHAFLEGDLLHFKGRFRARAPSALRAEAERLFQQSGDFAQTAQSARASNIRINYNPRFASCFYRDQANKQDIGEKFVAAQHIVVIGWGFWACAPTFTSLLAVDRASLEALGGTSLSERMALQRGRSTTKTLLAQHTPIGPSVEHMPPSTKPRKLS